MFKSIVSFLGLGLLICLLHSCVRPMYPGMGLNPMAPRMIPAVSDRGNVNALPTSTNFVQSYTNYKKSKTNSHFGALVRLIEFEYDISDSISITPRLTTGFDEGEMTGWFTIMLDQYELTYENKDVQVREYVEEISYEAPQNISRERMIYDPVGAAASNATQKKPIKVVNRSQLYNSAKFYLEAEDARYIQRSKTLYFKIQLQNCTMTIFPSKEQIRVLKRMILKHYFDS